ALLLALLSFTAAPTTVIYTLSLHDALPIFLGNSRSAARGEHAVRGAQARAPGEGHAVPARAGGARRACRRDVHDDLRALVAVERSEEHTSELQSRENLVCRLLLEKKNTRHL